ncbi:putative pectinesterase/pectinesterase inhibitor 12 [Quercus suber]|uniref:Pectinesterase/pectinesterase inhibitor 12 n=1 Tax=Quercus suber TaxID=58331 RepID=A0AAW0L2R0_QUESU
MQTLQLCTSAILMVTKIHCMSIPFDNSTESDILGTLDFILGNAAVIFQGCNIWSRMPMSGQFTVITAQSRDSPDEDIEISIQNCSILATNDLYSNSGSVKSYIGRPLRVYS